MVRLRVAVRVRVRVRVRSETLTKAGAIRNTTEKVSAIAKP